MLDFNVDILTMIAGGMAGWLFGQAASDYPDNFTGFSLARVILGIILIIVALVL
jgi:hypothetical protein